MPGGFGFDPYHLFRRHAVFLRRQAEPSPRPIERLSEIAVAPGRGDQVERVAELSSVEIAKPAAARAGKPDGEARAGLARERADAAQIADPLAARQ